VAKPKTIRIRPFALNDDRALGGNNPRLSIEIDGRILPLAKFVEIVGEIVPAKSTGTRDRPVI